MAEEFIVTFKERKSWEAWQKNFQCCTIFTSTGNPVANVSRVRKTRRSPWKTAVSLRTDRTIEWPDFKYYMQALITTIEGIPWPALEER